MATHTLSTAPRASASTQPWQERSLGPIATEGAETQSTGGLVCAEAAALLHTHLGWHICGQAGPAREVGAGNGEHKPCFPEQTTLTIIPPAPGKHFPFVGNCQDVRRTTGHLHHLVAQQGLHDLGLAEEEQQPSAETSQPAWLLPSLLASPLSPNTVLAAAQFPSNRNTREMFSGFFFVPNSLQRAYRVRAHSTKDNANISGAEESSQHDGLERE